MKNLRQYIRRLLKESKEEVDKIMQLWDADEWEQAQELAYMLGPEVSRHPDLKIWDIMNGENGDVVVVDLNYDQAMDPKYQAFVIFTTGYETMDDNPDSPYHGRKVGGGSAKDYPVPQEEFDNAMEWLEKEGVTTKVTKVYEDGFTVAVELVPV